MKKLQCFQPYVNMSDILFNVKAVALHLIRIFWPYFKDLLINLFLHCYINDCYVKKPNTRFPMKGNVSIKHGGFAVQAVSLCLRLLSVMPAVNWVRYSMQGIIRNIKGDFLGGRKTEHFGATDKSSITLSHFLSITFLCFHYFCLMMIFVVGFPFKRTPVCTEGHTYMFSQQPQ